MDIMKTEMSEQSKDENPMEGNLVSNLARHALENALH